MYHTYQNSACLWLLWSLLYANVHVLCHAQKVPTNTRLPSRISTTAIRVATYGTLSVPSHAAYPDTTVRVNTPSSDSVDRENSAAQQRLNSRTRDSSVSPRNGIDTVVTFAAKDSIVYTVSGRKLRLHRQAFVKHQAQTLSAELIELHIDKGVMRASTGRDSAGRVIGVPKFTDGKETVYGAELTYNFRTRRGIISMAETKFGDGLFFGERIKRVNDSTFFLRDGCYTTCDNPHPHFYFKAPRMKVIMPDRIYAEPLIVYFSNIPIAALPFGVFMENKQGRRSGILIPQVFFAGAIGDLNSRGIAFERIGYYWAISDTLDAELSGAYYTKGGWLANFKGNYFFSSRFNGDINLSYGQGGFTPNSPPSENWRVSWRHTWDITPFTNISGSIDISSSGFFQTTQLDARQRTQRGIQSQFGIRHTFDNGLPFNLDYRRFQDVGTNEIRQSISGGTSIPQIFPVRELIRSFPSLELTIPPDSWLNDIAVSYRLDAQANILTPSDSLLPGETEGDRRRRIAQARANPFTMRIAHAPSINIAPRLGYFVLSPSISYNEHWYFRRYANRIPTYSTTGTLTLVDEIEQGFFREYSASMSLGISTTLYGIAQPRLWGIQALRHTMRPQISLNYTPNFQADANLVGSYIDTIGGRSQRILYSRYSLDGGVLPSPLVAGIGWSLGNNFEAKIQQDTTETVVQLMQVNLAGSINMAADSMQWSPISMNFSNTFGDGVQLSGTASFSLYDRDTVRVGERALLQEVNRLLWSASKGILRLSQLSFNVNYRLSGNTETQTVQGGLIASGSTPKDTLAQQRIGEEAQIGQRFQRRLDNTYDQVDMFGDSSPGFSPLPLEWSSNITGTFSYSPSSIVGAPPLVSALFTADLTATVDRVWHITANMGVDIVNGTINAPSLSVQRDLHCWDMSFRWQPFGAVQGYFFRVGIKMPQLRDVQFIRQNNPFYRP